MALVLMVPELRRRVHSHIQWVRLLPWTVGPTVIHDHVACERRVHSHIPWVRLLPWTVGPTAARYCMWFYCDCGASLTPIVSELMGWHKPPYILAPSSLLLAPRLSTQQIKRLLKGL
jgi:hypothetical protein